VVGDIDEIQKDGPRPVTVEDLRGLFGKEFVGSVFEIVLIESVEPIPDSIDAGSVVRLGANLSDSVCPTAARVMTGQISLGLRPHECRRLK
jgi:hypothetical protein